MDTSEKYIEMCRQAKEIQELREKGNMDSGNTGSWIDGDFYSYVSEQTGIQVDNFSLAAIGESYHIDAYGKNAFDTAIFLPRQDQLQDMLGDFSICLHIMINLGTDIYISTSLEQLWLELVMKNKFKKLWDLEKNEWVAI